MPAAVGLQFDAAGEHVSFQSAAALVTVTLANLQIDARPWDGALIGQQRTGPLTITAGKLLLHRRDGTTQVRMPDLERVVAAWPSPSGELAMAAAGGTLHFLDLLAEESLGKLPFPAGVGPVAWNDRETRIAMALRRPQIDNGRTIGVRVFGIDGTQVCAIPSRALAHALDFAPDGRFLYWSDVQAHRTELATGRSPWHHDAPQLWWCTVDDALAVSHDGAKFTFWVAERMQPVQTQVLGERPRPGHGDGGMVGMTTTAPDRRRFALVTWQGLRIYRIVMP